MAVTLKITKRVTHHWKGTSKTLPFQRYITSPRVPKTSVGKPKKQTCSRLTTVDLDGQKNRNGKTAAVLFHIVFY
jgi:hypothetical protein